MGARPAELIGHVGRRAVRDALDGVAEPGGAHLDQTGPGGLPAAVDVVGRRRARQVDGVMAGWRERAVQRRGGERVRRRGAAGQPPAVGVGEGSREIVEGVDVLWRP